VVAAVKPAGRPCGCDAEDLGDVRGASADAAEVVIAVPRPVVAVRRAAVSRTLRVCFMAGSVDRG
jgi:hypothetical protein